MNRNGMRQEKAALAAHGLLCLFAFSLPLSNALSEAFGFPAILTGLWVYRRDLFRRRNWGPLAVPVLLFAAWMILGAFWSVRPERTLAKMHRPVLLLLIPLLGLDQARGSSDAGPPALRSGWRPRVGLSFCAGLTLHALLEIARIARYLGGGQSLYDAGTMTDPQLLSVGILLMAGWAAGVARPAARRGMVGAAAASLAALILHFKRGSWLAFGGALGLFYLLRKQWKLCLALILCAAGLLALPPVRARLAQLPLEWQEETGGRWVLWTRVGPTLIREHPFGMGYKAPVHEDFERYGDFIQPGLDHLHNAPMQVLLELGWIGLAFWTAWMAAALVAMAAGAREAPHPAARVFAQSILCAFVALLLNGAVEYNFGDGEIYRLMILLMGLDRAMRHAGPDGPQPA
jgi:O-antigen ligase